MEGVRAAHEAVYRYVHYSLCVHVLHFNEHALGILLHNGLVSSTSHMYSNEA